MQRRLALWGLLLSLCCVSYTVACGTDQRCFTDYNCPQGQYCVGLTCQDTPPPGVEIPKEITPEPQPEAGPEPQPEPQPEPKPEGPVACTQNSDCTDPQNTVCYDKVCVPGYVEFSFTSGHPILDGLLVGGTCSTNANCKKWQLCETRVNPARCYPRLDNAAQAKGRVGSNSYFLEGFAYSELRKIDGKDYLVISVNGDVSEKLQYLLEILVPIDLAQAGQLEIKPDGVKAYLYNNYVEFSPSRKVIVGEAVRGDIQLSLAGKALGDTIAGSANLILAPR
ncbi:MAG: hypothetical protein H6727_09515 [Myxococcales bacterium]|nr:hypothetical protein [Myxococcales bacterium]